MDNAYQDPNTALKYLEFLNSENGQIQQKVLLDVIKKALSDKHQLAILDAGCGPGWLAGALKKDFPKIEACDTSKFLVTFAKGNYPGVDFKVADVTQSLPYQKNYFDVVILNMVGPDLEKLDEAFVNTAAVLKPAGKIIMTIPNPSLTYPAAEWKRSLLDVLLMRMPQLKITGTILQSGKIQREFGKNIKINSYFYSLIDYIAAAKKADLQLLGQNEIRSQTDSEKFDLNYQLFRYPLLLLLEFQKLGK